MTKKIGIIILLIAGLNCAGCSPEQVAAWKQASQQAAQATVAISDEIAALESEYANLNLSDPIEEQRSQRIAAKLGALRTEWDDKAAIVIEMNENIQKAEDAFGIAEVIIGVASGFIPGIGIAIPLIRRWKTAFETVVVAVSEGGGPMKPELTAKSMGSPTSRVRTMVRHVNIASGLKT